jgi:uncharacterized protein (TIGR02646 family)
VRYIEKGREPSKLASFKQKNRNLPEMLCYKALDRGIMQSLRTRMLREQGALCAYTMAPIGRQKAVDFHIEHIRPQWRDDLNELDYHNMVLCAPGDTERPNCKWGAVKKGGALVDESNFVSPLNSNCEQRLKFGARGDVRPSSEADRAAKRTIDLLALNHPLLVSARAYVLREYGLASGSQRPITAAQAERLAQAILVPNRAGHLQPFCIAIKQVAERFARQTRARAARLSKTRGA